MFRRSPVCWTMPVTTSPTRSMYSSYIISRSASRIRCRMTCFAVCAAMRPKLSGVTSSRLTQLLGDLRPVDLEVVVGEQRVVLLARLLLDALELVERALARLVEQAHLEVGGELDREHAEVPAVVELDRRVPRRAGRLLVRREQRVLERGDERAALDSLLALDLANGVNDLLAHPFVPFIDQVGPHDLVVRDVRRLRPLRDLNGPLTGGDHLAARAARLGLDTHASADGALEVLARAQRPLEARRGDLDAVGVEVGPQHVGDALAERMVDALRVVDVDAEALLAGQLEREHLDAGQGALDQPSDVALQRLLLLVRCARHLKTTPTDEKWAPRAHLENRSKWCRKGSRDPLPGRKTLDG